MNDQSELVLFCTVSDYGTGSKLLNKAKKLGAYYSTIFLGQGTLKHALLNFLGVMETKKEVLVSIIDQEKEAMFHEEIAHKFNLDKAHHGISFSIPIKYCLRKNGILSKDTKEVNKMSYEAIFVIVNKDSLESVLDAAEKAGSTGGTIIHARGTADKSKEKLFDFQIEPEKDVVLILSKADKTETIVNAIEDSIRFEKDDSGILFVLDVNDTRGLRK